MKTIHTTLCLCASAIVLVAGCQPVKTDQGLLQAEPSQPAMTYPQLAAKYNQRIALIDQLWSTTSIMIRWTDERGDSHFEQGEGPLIWRKTNDLALAIGKLGKTRYWLGCGDQAKLWWLFDLGDERRIAYRGKLNAPLSVDDRRLLPVPVRPDQLVRILGITPLDLAHQPTITTDGDQYVLTFPAEPALGNLRQQLRIDAKFRATRITLLDEKDQPVVEASLGRYAPLTLQGHPPGAFPDIATTIDITLTHPAASITIVLSEPGDGKLRNKVKELQFDFDKLAAALNIDELRPVGPSPEEGDDASPPQP